jgi:hypothetical protein
MRAEHDTRRSRSFLGHRKRSLYRGRFRWLEDRPGQLKNGAPRRRVGLIVEEAPARCPCPQSPSTHFELWIALGVRMCLYQKLQTILVRILDVVINGGNNKRS